MKIKRDQKIYDHDLTEQGLKRSTKTEWIDTAAGIRPLYREIVISNNEFTTDRMPWWKQKPRRRKS